MTFFSQQGIPFAQAVGAVESTERLLGSLRAYHDGSLGQECPPCNCAAPPPPGGGFPGDNAFALDTPSSWHDGIFRAQRGQRGTLHATNDGVLSSPLQPVMGTVLDDPSTRSAAYNGVVWGAVAAVVLFGVAFGALAIGDMSRKKSVI